MLKIEKKTCKICGRVYVWKSGGIMINFRDYVDYGLCKSCRRKMLRKTMK